VTQGPHRLGFDPPAVGFDPSWELPAFTTTELGEKKRDYCLLVLTLNQGEVLRAQLRRMQSQIHLVDIVLCDGASDDGSTDPEFLRECNVRALLVSPERGIGSASRVGLAYGLAQGYRGILMMDGNGKDRVSTIADVVRALEDGYDMVQASRFLPGGGHANTPLERWLGIRLVCSPILSLASRFYWSDPTNSFKGMSRRYLLDPRLRPFRRVFRRYSLHYQLNKTAPWLGYRALEVPHVRAYPDADRGSLFRTEATRIRGLRPRLQIVWELLLSAVGHYDVRR
jgi:dolichol-phosphate mannosyltransferase